MGVSIVSDGVGKPFLQLMMTCYVKTPEIGVSILNDEVGKPLSMRPVVNDDLGCRNDWNGCIHFQW